jgi:hypothetical protein
MKASLRIFLTLCIWFVILGGGLGGIMSIAYLAASKPSLFEWNGNFTPVTLFAPPIIAVAFLIWFVFFMKHWLQKKGLYLTERESGLYDATAVISGLAAKDLAPPLPYTYKLSIVALTLWLLLGAFLALPFGIYLSSNGKTDLSTILYWLAWLGLITFLGILLGIFLFMKRNHETLLVTTDGIRYLLPVFRNLPLISWSEILSIVSVHAYNNYSYSNITITLKEPIPRLTNTEGEILIPGFLINLPEDRVAYELNTYLTQYMNKTGAN